MKDKTKTKKNHHSGRIIKVLLMVILVVIAVMGAVYLIAGGYAKAALETILRWNEDGTLDRFGVILNEKIIPWLTGVGGAVGVSWILALQRNKKTDKAVEALNAGTAEAVKTYGERQEMQTEMQDFMGKQAAAMEAMQAEQTAQLEAMQAEQAARLDALEAEQRASLAADRAAIKRIEGKVDGIRRMDVEAYGATAELVKKGVSSRIVSICEETEGDELTEEETEGGEGGEAHGDDGQAAEATEADR